MSDLEWNCNSYYAAVLPLPARGTYLIIAEKKRYSPRKKWIVFKQPQNKYGWEKLNRIYKDSDTKALFFT